ncbi:DUF3850 domain-containing protein [Cronobacter sakazakii]|nr:DUF3850 domain-containing protein [Cronobacter sakazakii]
MREPVTHNLKIWPEHYSAVCAGLKRAELRKNDRDYRVGDTLDLCEWDKDDESFTGEFISVTVTHVADVGEWMPGYVLLSIERALLALRERAEPVAWTDEQELRDAKKSGVGYLFGMGAEANKFVDPHRKMMLYSAPPAPVVPDDAVVGWVRDEEGDSRDPLFLLGTVRPLSDGKAYNSTYYPVKRAAMLQPVSQPYKLPGKEE